MPFKAVVRLLVEVKVHTHDGKADCFISIDGDSIITVRLLNVAHQHNGMVINCLFLSDIVNYIPDFFLIYKSSVEIFVAGACGGEMIASVSFSDVDTIVAVVVITDIDGLAPIGFDGNGRDAIGNIVVAALSKDAATDGVKVFVGAFAVSEVVTILPVFQIGALCATTDSGNLPARHHRIGVVAGILLGPSVPVGVAEDGVEIR